MIHHGDLFDVLPTLAEASIDACVTDPPYGIGFMGKEWDSFRRARNLADVGRDSVMGRLSRSAPASGAESDSLEFEAWTELWGREVLRVLKPGAYIAVFAATRNYHRMACGLEDAGFVIRDKFSWLFGSGFPKNYNLGDGKGTALKPAHEPIALAWKPFKGSIKGCYETHGTAALNIDACRIGESRPAMAVVTDGEPREFLRSEGRSNVGTIDEGRWPANVLLDEEAAALLDEQTGELGFSSGTEVPGNAHPHGIYGTREKLGVGAIGFGDRGGASRFYYVAKPSREERDYGTEGLAARQRDENRKAGNPGGDNPRNRGLQPRGNFHPTVKPVELMRWLVKLVTPIGGVVLDPFTGSGTTGMACRYEQRQFIGIEREADYIAIAEARIGAVAPLFGEATA